MKDTTFKISGREYKKYEVEIVDGEENYRLTEEWKNYSRRLIIGPVLEKAGIIFQEKILSLKDYSGKDVADNLPKIQKFILEFETRYRKTHLYLWSKFNGTQKTTTAKVIAAELSKKGLSVQFVLMNQLIEALTEMNETGSTQELLRNCRSVDFLIIDDCFDVNKITIYKSGYQLSFIDTFLRERLEANRKSTCFTSNVPPEEIDQKFGISIRSLVQRSTAALEFNDVFGDFEISSIWED